MNFRKKIIKLMWYYIIKFHRNLFRNGDTYRGAIRIIMTILFSLHAVYMGSMLSWVLITSPLRTEKLLQYMHIIAVAVGDSEAYEKIKIVHPITISEGYMVITFDGSIDALSDAIVKGIDESVERVHEADIISDKKGEYGKRVYRIENPYLLTIMKYEIRKIMDDRYQIHMKQENFYTRRMRGV